MGSAMPESHNLERDELEALRDEFDELIRREPAPDIDTVFDAAMRRRVGMVISRLTARAEPMNRRPDSSLP